MVETTHAVPRPLAGLRQRAIPRTANRAWEGT
jgi:hypothetical protein